MSFAPNEILLKPRTWPRDGVDFIVQTASSLTGLGMICGPAFVLGWWLSDLGVLAGGLAALGMLFLYSAIHGPRLVTALRINSQGVWLKRALLPQRLLEWPRITAVYRAPRGVAIRDFFNPWGFTMNGTSLDMFRIAWTDGAIFFAPADVDTFRRAIHRWRPDLMPPIDPEPPGAALRLPPREETGNPYQAPKSDLMDGGGIL